MLQVSEPPSSDFKVSQPGESITCNTRGCAFASRESFPMVLQASSSAWKQREYMTEQNASKRALDSCGLQSTVGPSPLFMLGRSLSTLFLSSILFIVPVGKPKRFSALVILGLVPEDMMVDSDPTIETDCSCTQAATTLRNECHCSSDTHPLSIMVLRIYVYSLSRSQSLLYTSAAVVRYDSF